MASSGAHAMDKKRQETYKKKLQVKREDLVRNIARVEEEGRAADVDTTVDLADKAANSYTKEFLFGQTNVDRNLLGLVDGALVRIKTGSYGTCIECEEELQQKRLEAVPWARHCVKCAEKHEQGLL
jgi:DnaK suppressor protein